MDADKFALSEELLLLSLGDGAAAATPPMAFELALAGAVTLDLMLLRRIEIEREHVRLVDWEPTRHRFLDGPLRNLQAAGHPPGLVEWLRSLAEEASEAKHAIFRSLVGRGVLSVEKRPLVLDFLSHRYRNARSGKPNRIVESLAGKQPPAARDLMVIGLANAGGVLDKVLSKKKRRSLNGKIEQAMAMQGAAEPVLRTIDLLRRPERDDPSKGERPRDRPRPNNWEWRAFWGEESPELAPIGPIADRPVADYKLTRVTDRYLLIPERRDNIKVRKNGLEVKQQIETYRQFQAFRPKQVFKFPIRADGMTEIFPRMYGLDDEIGDLDAMQAVLERFDYRPRWLEVTKTRYRLRLGEESQVEFCAFETGGKYYRSICVEGPDHAHVLALVHTLNPRSARVMGYIEFLNRIGAGHD